MPLVAAAAAAPAPNMPSVGRQDRAATAPNNPPPTLDRGDHEPLVRRGHNPPVEGVTPVPRPKDVTTAVTSPRLSPNAPCCRSRRVKAALYGGHRGGQAGRGQTALGLTAVVWEILLVILGGEAGAAEA